MVDQAENAYSRDERASLSKLVTRLFEKWELPTDQQLALLGISIDSRSTLTRYRRGEPVGPNRDLLDRIGHLLAIHKNLRLLFPRQPERIYGWMRQRNRAFEGRTPAEAVAEFGFPGLLMVRAYLDRARGS